MRACCTLLLALALGGCAFTPQLHRVAVDHNRMVARATDEMTLLNIVRASRRFPLHFTAITEVDGEVSLTAGANASIDLDPRVDPADLELGGEVQTTPSFRAAVLATEKFQRGIQNPLSEELIAYYLEEGWRDELLMALTVERVDVFASASDPAPLAAIVNRGERGSAFNRLLCTHALVSRPTAASLPLASFADVVDRQGLAAVGTSAAERRKEIAGFLDLVGREDVVLDGDRLLLDGSRNAVGLMPRETSRCEGVIADAQWQGRVLRPRFRSTLGVIYFVGEYVRQARISGAQGAYALPDCDDPCAPGFATSRPLIDIERGKGRALVATEFFGERYYIAQGEAMDDAEDRDGMARSMQVLALVEQLVNLQKAADLLPASVTVRGINR